MKKVVGYMLMLIVIISGAIMIYQQYPNMSEQVKKLEEPYFETWDFANRLIEGSNYFSYLFEGENISDEMKAEASPFWEYTMNRYPNELDYFAVNLINSDVKEREGTLLKKLFEAPEDANLWNELESHYQFIVQMTFSELGNVRIEQIMGAERSELEPLLSNVISHEDTRLKEMTVIYGVPKDLQVGGAIYQGIHSYREDNFILISIPYLIVTAIAVIFVTLLIPYRWIRDFGLVKGLLVVPLELRFLFVIGTIFATVGAPFLIAFTQQGFLAEGVAWYVDEQQVKMWVDLINIICWSGFIFVIAVHTLYLKEFFIIGPWQMIRRHTMLGQLYGILTKRKKPLTEIIVEEKVIFQEDPTFSLMKSKVLSLAKQLETVEDEAYFRVKRELMTDLIQLAEEQESRKLVNLRKLLADTLIHIPESFDLKTKMPDGTLMVMSSEQQLAMLMNQLMQMIAQDAMNQSRIYVEVLEHQGRVKVILRYVTADKACLSEEAQQEISLRIEKLGGEFELLRDGDLIKIMIDLSQQ